MNKLSRLEDDARDSIVAVLADFAVRKLSTYTWYIKNDKTQALRALAAGVAFLDSAVLASLAADDNTDIRQEYLRIKNYIVNNCPECDSLSSDMDSLSHISFYITNENKGKKGKAESLVDYW